MEMDVPVIGDYKEKCPGSPRGIIRTTMIVLLHFVMVLFYTHPHTAININGQLVGGT